ncbi:MAG: CarD family transcriptional regulator, partial [Chloroflexota bacterium]
MSLRHIVPLVSEEPVVRAVLDALAAGPAPVTDVAPSVRPALAAAAISREPGAALVLAARADRADAFAAALAEFLPAERETWIWPAPEALPFEQLPFDLEIATRRVAILHRLAESAGDPSRPGPVIVLTAHGLLQLLLDPASLASHTRIIRPGDRIDARELLSWSVEHGYVVAPLVQEPGEVARRGGIIDIFPPGAGAPMRLDLFGDEVESIRTFEIGSQRSIERQSHLALLPPSELPLWRLGEIAADLAALDRSGLRPEVDAEWRRMIDSIEAGATPASVDLFAPYLLPGVSTLLDYLGTDPLVVIDEPEAMLLAARQLGQQAEELAAGFVANGELPPGLRSPLAPLEVQTARLANWRTLSLGAGEPGAASLAPLADAPRFLGRLDDATGAVEGQLAAGWRAVIATDQVDRLTDSFEERGVMPRRQKRGARAAATPPPQGVLEILDSGLNGGFVLPESKLVLYTDLEIFGFRKQARRTGRRVSGESGLLSSLQPGEHVVHIDHGIARFAGLIRMETGGVEREYMLLEYAREDRLYVPVDQSDRVSRYSGGGIDPVLTRLGSGEWVQVKRKVRKAVREMAFELIQLYAARETVRRRPCMADTTWDHELAESFPFTETPDQARAIAACTTDLEGHEPMDRLVCGDVGFGKTEVALRAAFKAVNNGRQVAVLVPPPVLALQHFTTCAQRLAPFPVKVEMLSRL